MATTTIIIIMIATILAIASTFSYVEARTPVLLCSSLIISDTLRANLNELRGT